MTATWCFLGRIDGRVLFNQLITNDGKIIEMRVVRFCRTKIKISRPIRWSTWNYLVDVSGSRI